MNVLTITHGIAYTVIILLGLAGLMYYLHKYYEGLRQAKTAEEKGLRFVNILCMVCVLIFSTTDAIFLEKISAIPTTFGMIWLFTSIFFFFIGRFDR